ncbi:MAG: hypothetical protein ABIU54_14550, partial [Candidatus Eisenbacteria bacterium]
AAHHFLTLLKAICPESRLGPSCLRHMAPSARTLNLRASRCSRLIGLPFTLERCAELLHGLEFKVRKQGDALIVEIPTWRSDCTLEDDLVEEVARSHGYDRIPEAPLETGGAFATRSPRERVVRRAREAMLSLGLHEAWSSSLVSEPEGALAAPLMGHEGSGLVRLVNPMSRESEVLRPNLVPGLLRAVSHNLKQGAQSVRLFEVGAGFTPSAEALPSESLMLCAVVAGQRWRHTHDTSPAKPDLAYDPRSAADFFDAKGVFEAWLGEMRVDSPQWHAYSGLGWKPGASAEVAVAGSRIAWAGTLSRKLLAAWEIEADVQLFIALLEPLTERLTATTRAKVPGRYPAVRRDLAFFVPRAVPHAEVSQSLTRAAGGTMSTLELFDIYDGPGTPVGMKSLAYALSFQHAERTLTETEVTELQTCMVAAVANDCGGQLRER